LMFIICSHLEGTWVYMINLTLESLPYSSDLVAHYQSLCDLPGFVLLESTDRTRGRYDIISACPYDRFVVKPTDPNLHTVFDRLQAWLPSYASSCDLPFQGGAIGYFSYDLGSRLAGVIPPPPHPLLAKQPLVDLGLYDWGIIVDHEQKKVTLLAAHQDAATQSVLDLIKARWTEPVQDVNFSLSHAFQPLMTEQDYRVAFQAIHQDLTNGRAYQVNLTQSFVAEYEGDCWEMYRRIRQGNPVPYAAFIRNPDSDIISFSPERFLLYEQGHLLTSPIKGTMPRSKDPVLDQHYRQALEDSSKNRAENVMIVDLMRNDLGRIAKAGSVTVSALCEVQSYKGVHHLVSTVEAEIEETISPLSSFAACFPGGSITGAPKREVMQIIAEHEKVSRGIYCGSIGYFSAHGRFDTNLAIRTLTAVNQHVFLAAGGGLVVDSKAADEYDECFAKIAAIVALMQ